MDVAVRTAVAVAAPPSTNAIELDKALDRGEPAVNPGSRADESALENARGNTGTFQFGDINMANGSSAPLTRAA
jgi:hypothetical protein